MKDITKVAKALQRAQSVLIGSHYNPDGDALGSSLALRLALEGVGKRVVVYNRDPVPFNLAFLPHVDRIVGRLPVGVAYDTAVLVDVSDPERVSDDFSRAIGSAHLICIDHHVIERQLASTALIDPNAAATGELIYRVIRKMRVPLDATLAEYIYCALVVDTGFFKYSNTDERVLRLAADLVAAGAVPERIASQLEENFPPERFHLLAQTLATLDIDRVLRYASIVITQAMLAETRATVDLSDEFGSIPRAIAGVEIAALFRELPDGRVKVSLRSKGDADCIPVARTFSGGGHQHAAGCTLAGGVEAVKRQIKEAIQAMSR